MKNLPDDKFNQEKKMKSKKKGDLLVLVICIVQLAVSNIFTKCFTAYQPLLGYLRLESSFFLFFFFFSQHNPEPFQ